MKLVALVCVAAAAACGGKGEDSSSKSESKTKPSTSSPANNRYRLRPPASLSVEEAKTALPVPDGVRSLGEPQRLSHNRVVRTNYCVDGVKDVSAALAKFTETLAAKGWRNVRTAPNRSPKRRGASAQKQRLRVAMMAQTMELPNCAASKDQIRVSISVYKLSRAPSKMVREALRKRRQELKAKQPDKNK